MFDQIVKSYTSIPPTFMGREWGGVFSLESYNRGLITILASDVDVANLIGHGTLEILVYYENFIINSRIQ